MKRNLNAAIEVMKSYFVETVIHTNKSQKKELHGKTTDPHQKR